MRASGCFSIRSSAASHVSDWQAQNQLAAPGLGKQTLLGTLPDPAQFRLTHGSFEPEQEPVVGLARVVHAFVVDDQRVHQTAQIEQLIPVAIVARQARHFDGEDRADAAQPYLGHQLLEAGARRAARARASQVLIDHGHLVPAQLLGSRRQVVLTPPAFVVMADLANGGLTHIH